MVALSGQSLILSNHILPSFPFRYFLSSTINRSLGHGALGTLNPKQTNVPKQTLFRVCLVWTMYSLCSDFKTVKVVSTPFCKNWTDDPCYHSFCPVVRPRWHWSKPSCINTGFKLCPWEGIEWGKEEVTMCFTYIRYKQ